MDACPIQANASNNFVVSKEEKTQCPQNVVGRFAVPPILIFA
jgi:hypothetical protein